MKLKKTCILWRPILFELMSVLCTLKLTYGGHPCPEVEKKKVASESI